MSLHCSYLNILMRAWQGHIIKRAPVAPLNPWYVGAFHRRFPPNMAFMLFSWIILSAMPLLFIFFLFLFFLNMPVGARENNTGLLQDSDATAGKKYFLLPRIRTFVHFNNLFPSAFYYIFYLWIHYSLVSSIFSYLYAFLLNPFRFFPKMCMTQVGVIPPPLPLHLPLCKAPLLKSCVFW